MRPLPIDYHRFLAEIEELHEHGILHRGGPDGEDFVCRYEDCDAFIRHSEIIRGAIDRQRTRKVIVQENAEEIRELDRADRTKTAKATVEESRAAMRQWHIDHRTGPTISGKLDS